MRIYLDVCAYNRPFDNQDQDRVYLEAESILAILNYCQNEDWILVGSDVVDFEINKMQNSHKKEKVLSLSRIAQEHLCLTEPIEKRAVELQGSGIKLFDSLHLALAETGKVNVFLTTDDRLVRLSKKTSLNLKVENPLNWISEVL